MSAQPLSNPAPDDPVEILRVLPVEHHAWFQAEYAAALEDAREVARYPALREQLQLWQLRAVALSDPGLAERRARVNDPNAGIPIDDLVPGGRRA